MSMDLKEEIKQDKSCNENSEILYHQLSDLITKMNEEKKICTSIAQKIHDLIFESFIIHQQTQHNWIKKENKNKLS